MNIQEELDFSTIRIPNEDEVLLVTLKTDSLMPKNELYHFLENIRRHLETISKRKITVMFLPNDISVESLSKDLLRQRLQRILDNL